MALHEARCLLRRGHVKRYSLRAGLEAAGEDGFRRCCKLNLKVTCDTVVAGRYLNACPSGKHNRSLGTRGGHDEVNQDRCTPLVSHDNRVDPGRERAWTCRSVGVLVADV
jgi:hypothetical protein